MDTRANQQGKEWKVVPGAGMNTTLPDGPGKAAYLGKLILYVQDVNQKDCWYLLQVTDHIIPVEIHKDFWDKKNWQPLCTRCNIIKGNEDKKLINNKREYR